ncbi:MAG: NADH-quinone oxidoreductase subunit C [Desulfomonilaceae bacterium]
MNQSHRGRSSQQDFIHRIRSRWPNVELTTRVEEDGCAVITCEGSTLGELCERLFCENDYAFATLIVEEEEANWLFRYVFYGGAEVRMVYVCMKQPKSNANAPSISAALHAADWHEREVEDLFGICFEGHPRLGDFVLHEEWPEGVNPMRKGFDASKPYVHREVDPEWRPLRILEAQGAFMMPIGPVYSDYAEACQFFLETVGEDVVRTTPRIFYKFRGVEKLAENQPVERVLLMAERFSGSSAFAHSLAFCRAVEKISGMEPPPRGQVLRVLFAELERLRHHVGAIAGICGSTALAVATSQASILEEELLRLSCIMSGHRYLFGINRPGGISIDVASDQCEMLRNSVTSIASDLKKLFDMLRLSSSFLDRIEEVGIVSKENALSYGLVGPVARGSGIARDLRKILPYGPYRSQIECSTALETEGDGYARLRVLFREAEESANVICRLSSELPSGDVSCPEFHVKAGQALGWVEAPLGAAFHWVNIGEDGAVKRYRVTPPSFMNWHGFHLAAENFAFQDFPIVMATFGLSNAECDR